MIALSDKIAASGIKPWCAGIESGDATGWPATDWIEDVMLRTQGPEVYDQWTTHEIPFNDPRIVDAVDRAGTILKNEKYVNGGFGGVKSIATTAFQEAGLPITAGKCAMHRQASFYANQLPEGTKVAEDGDAFAFYFPAIDPAKGKPVLGGGEFVVGFADRPEVQAVQTYLASAEYANSRAKLGNWVTANNKLDIANVANPIDKLSVQILQDKTRHLPLRRFRPDAGRRRRGNVLEGHGRVDQRQGRPPRCSRASRAAGLSDPGGGPARDRGPGHRLRVDPRGRVDGVRLRRSAAEVPHADVRAGRLRRGGGRSAPAARRGAGLVRPATGGAARRRLGQWAPLPRRPKPREGLFALFFLLPTLLLLTIGLVVPAIRTTCSP